MAKKEEKQALVAPTATSIEVGGQMLDYGADAGRGMEMASLGGRLPFLSLLQGQSKAAQEGTEQYIEGARSGMLCIASQKKTWSGKDGLIFIGICERHHYNERTAKNPNVDNGMTKWIGDHEPGSDVVAKARAKATKRNDLRTDAGNVLWEAFSMHGFILDEVKAPTATMAGIEAALAKLLDGGQGGIPIVLDFESTKLGARRAIMERVRSFKRGVPLYAIALRICSVPVTKDGTTFYNYSIKFAVEDDLPKSLVLPNSEVWPEWSKNCRKFAEMVATGTIQGDPTEKQAAASDGGDEAKVPF